MLIRELQLRSYLQPKLDACRSALASYSRQEYLTAENSLDVTLESGVRCAQGSHGCGFPLENEKKHPVLQSHPECLLP